MNMSDTITPNVIYFTRTDVEESWGEIGVLLTYLKERPDERDTYNGLLALVESGVPFQLTTTPIKNNGDHAFTLNLETTAAGLMVYRLHGGIFSPLHNCEFNGTEFVRLRFD